MITIEIILLSFLVIVAVAICLMDRLLSAVILFASYCVVMSVVWMLLAAPDLAITEAAVGTGVTSILFFVLLKRVRIIEKENSEENEANINDGETLEEHTNIYSDTNKNW